MSNATVTIPYDEFQALHEARKEAELAVSLLQQSITNQKIEASDPRLLALAHACIDVVRYAVANLPPESNRGWPFESLKTISDEILRMPDAASTHNELSMTFKNFALECEQHERRRQMRARVKQEPAPLTGMISTQEIVAPPDQDP